MPTLEEHAQWWRRIGDTELHLGTRDQKSAWGELVQIVTDKKAPTVADITQEQWVQLRAGHALIFG